MFLPTIDDLPFETEQLGFPCGHLNALQPDTAAADIATALQQCREKGIQFLSTRIPASNIQLASELEDQEFRFIECLLTLERPLAGPPAFPDGVTFAEPNDAADCATVAASAFRADRFHRDPRIDDAAASRLKAAWARNSVGGRANKVFLTRENGRIVGFNAVVIRDNAAAIDLIAVHPEAQGRGHGRRLVDAALQCYATVGRRTQASLNEGSRVERMRVGTQADNIGSLALYAAAGFTVVSATLTFHFHVPAKAGRKPH